MYSVDKSLNSFVEFNSNYCALCVALVNKIRKKKASRHWIGRRFFVDITGNKSENRQVELCKAKKFLLSQETTVKRQPRNEGKYLPTIHRIMG